MATDIGSVVAHLLLDRSEFTNELRAARADAKGGVDVPVRMDTARFDAESVKVEAEKAALGHGVDIPVRMDVAGSLAAATALSRLSRPLLNQYAELAGITGAGDMANKGDVISALVAAGMAQGSSGGSGGGGNGGLLAGLAGFFGGKGGKSVLGAGTGFLGFAGAGSLLSFAGLGFEHLLMTGLGLGGSAIGGMLGGGLLGAGALGVGAVGMGTDLAGVGQAAGDIRSYTQAYNNLQKAIAEYGAGSTQAQHAQNLLNYTLAGFPPVAQRAIVAASQTAGQFHAMFNSLTGPAEKIGAEILTQAMQVGEKFLPTIGKFAAANTAETQKGLQPLFAWMTSSGPMGGLGIFTDLEKKFSSELPTALDAFDNAVELVAKTIDVASHYTGGFIVQIDHFLQRVNSPAGFSKWSTDIGKLIGDFRMWEALLKAAGQDVYYLFHNDAGTASSIVQWLTQMLDKLGQWERSTQGSAQIHNIFEVHKQEIMALLALLPSLITSFGHIYLTVAPALTHALTEVLQVIVPILDALSHTPGGAWIIGLGLIAAKLGILKPALGGIVDLFTGFGKNAAKAADDSVSGFDRMAAGVKVLGAIGIVVGVGVTAFQALTHWINSSKDAADNAGKAMAGSWFQGLQQTNEPLTTQISLVQQQIDKYQSLQDQLHVFGTANSSFLGLDEHALSGDTKQWYAYQAAIKSLTGDLTTLQQQQATQTALSTLLMGHNATLANSETVLGQATGNVSSAMSSYNTILAGLSGNTQNAVGAQLQIRSDLLNVSGALKTAGASMGGTNQQSLTLQQSVLQFARDLTGQYMPALASAGTSTHAITQQSQAFVGQLNAMLHSLGYTPAQIAAVDKQFGITNPTIATAANNLAGVVSNSKLAGAALGNLTTHPWTLTVNSNLQNLLNQAGALGSILATDLNVSGSIHVPAGGSGVAGLIGPGLPHHARGGPGSGWSWVGEQGPELVRLPAGSYVHTASESARMGGGMFTYAPHYTVSVGSAQDKAEFEQMLDEHDRKAEAVFRQLTGISG